MSDTHTWNVDILGEYGTAEFQETSATNGQTVHADFTWNNAVKIGDIYAAMWIFDPDGNVHAYDYVTQEPAGLQTLQCVIDMPGIWVAKIEVWDGFVWQEYFDYITVSSSFFVIDYSTSDFFTGPFPTNATVTVANIAITNTGDIATPGIIKLYEDPSYSTEAYLGYVDVSEIQPGTTSLPIPVTVLTPLDAINNWLLGVKVYGTGNNGETEPPWWNE